MSHKFQYSLDLLGQVIAKAPKFFPAGRRQDMQDALSTFFHAPDVSRQQIDEAIIAFGKEIWPYRKAFWHIHDTDGRHDETVYFKEALAPELAAKYAEFVKKGFRIEDIRHGGEFEHYFSPEEKRALIDSKLTAHDRVVAGIEELCAGEHRQTCADALAGYRTEQKKIEELVRALAGWADRSEKWRAEILDKVRTFEEGWSGLEREVGAEGVQGEIDYYRGIIELEEGGE